MCQCSLPLICPSPTPSIPPLYPDMKWSVRFSSVWDSFSVSWCEAFFFTWRTALKPGRHSGLPDLLFVFLCLCFVCVFKHNPVLFFCKEDINRRLMRKISNHLKWLTIFPAQTNLCLRLFTAIDFNVRLKNVACGVLCQRSVMTLQLCPNRPTPPLRIMARKNR